MVCEITTGEDGVESERRRRETEREQRINGVRECVLVRNGNGVG
jgi:hypothetical protein